MKNSIAQIVASAVAGLPDLDESLGAPSLVTIERTRDARHGDFACNIAMRLAKPARSNPRDLAQRIIDQLPASEIIDTVEIAGPGFINIRVSKSAYEDQIREILDARADFGRAPKKDGPRHLLEFVSANPTGPLHVGHGRLASYGATVGNLLEAAGYPVHREYYVNDAGRQMDILGVSVYLRMLEQQQQAINIPAAGYRGDYVRDVAAEIDIENLNDVTAEQLFDDIPADAPDGDKEAHIDALIGRAKELIGEESFEEIRWQSQISIRNEMRDDLEAFGVTYDRWFSEKSLSDEGRIDEALAVLQERRMLYQKDGATWFKATDFGDEKDRVVIRENGVKTYFASDIAYHFDKRKRGFDVLVDILGADHHGYIARVRAGLDAMGFEGKSLEVQLVQFVSLYRDGVKQQMSTRSGEFVTLRQLREDVGNDAARFFYVMRSNDQHLDFDLDLAKSRSNENPVYYIQYAHARVASVFRQLDEKSLQWREKTGRSALSKLVEPQEVALMRSLSRYPEVIELAAHNRAPQHLVHYLRELANDFHAYYNAHQFIVDDADLRDARLTLISAMRIVVANGLSIIGVSSPDTM